jgi:Tfp pilus assembly protein PilZ
LGGAAFLFNWQSDYYRGKLFIMAEKRKSKRKIRRLPVTFSSQGVEFTGNTSNVSCTGMFIRTRKPFKTGIPVEISLHVDNDHTINLNARTVRATKLGSFYRKNGMGVQLLSQSEEYSNFLKEQFV